MVGNRWLEWLAEDKPNCGQIEVQPHEFVERTLLNLPAVFPARQGGFRHTQPFRQLFLRQAEILPLLPNLLRRQQTGLSPECLADLYVGFRIQNGIATLPAAEPSEGWQRYRVRAAIVEDLRSVRFLNGIHLALSALSALPREGADFWGITYVSHDDSQSVQREPRDLHRLE